MRKIALTAVSMALMAAPAALANRGGAAPADTTVPAAATTQTPAVVLAPCTRAPVGRRRGDFVLRGVVASVNGPTVMVQATGVNARMRKALQGPTAQGGGSYDAMIPVTIADCTRLDVHVRSEQGRGRNKRRGVQAIVAGARIRVEWRAPRGTAFADLGSPKRVWVR